MSLDGVDTMGVQPEGHICAHKSTTRARVHPGGSRHASAFEAAPARE